MRNARVCPSNDEAGRLALGVDPESSGHAHCVGEVVLPDEMSLITIFGFFCMLSSIIFGSWNCNDTGSTMQDGLMVRTYACK